MKKIIINFRDPKHQGIPIEKFVNLLLRPELISAFVVVLFFAAAAPVLAAGLVPCGGPGESPCDLCFLFSMVKTIVDFIFLLIIPPVAALIIILSGFNLIVNKDSAEAMNKTKKVLFSTLMGLAIILTGWVVVNTALSAMKVTAWEGTGGNWWSFSLTCAKVDTGAYTEGDLEVCKGSENP